MFDNIRQFFYFRDSPNGLQTFKEFQMEFGFELAGVDAFYGINEDNYQNYRHTGNVLDEMLEWVLQMVFQRLSDPDHPVSSKTIMLGLEPNQEIEPKKHVRPAFDYVWDHMDMVTALAVELNKRQQSVPPGKTLDIVIRYASEMNSGDLPYGPPVTGDRTKQIRDYVDSFQAIREVFRASAPDIRFSFSPALRADRTLLSIATYWPGERYVDLISGTWYVHGPDQYRASTDLMQSYFLSYLRYGKPLCLDEIGGADGTVDPPVYNNNDVYLWRMLSEMGQLRVPFEYVTLWLNKPRWGVDVTLKFLEPYLPRPVSMPTAVTSTLSPPLYQSAIRFSTPSLTVRDERELSSMNIQNVGRILYHRNNPETKTLSMREFQDRYHFEPNGVNCYYGINQWQADRAQSEHSAMSKDHRAVLQDALDTLLNGGDSVKQIDLGLWPLEKTGDPYEFVIGHLDLVGHLASELKEYQDQALAQEKELKIVVRYASEMNDVRYEHQPWGRTPGITDDREQQARFRSTFRTVRQVFRDLAPAIRFAFSPAIRRDIVPEKYEVIPRYWPGDGEVDIISCTWYTGREDDYLGSVEVLRKYFLQRKERNLPFGIDEMGGKVRDEKPAENDAMLKRMFNVLEGLKSEGVSFEYVSLFLDAAWGEDATLDFLR
jgi:beta-mannanase